MRIFDATTGGRFDLAPAVRPYREALYLTLAYLVAEFIEYGARPRYATPAQARAVRKAFQEFEARLNAVSGTREPAPKPPPPYRGKLEGWVEGHESPLFGKGRPPSDFAHKVYPRLLALYALAFGREPSAAGGPTHRFVQGIFAEVRRALGGASRRWAVPTTEALKKRLPPFLRSSSLGDAGREVSAVFECNKAEL